jgi:acetoacetate decarboxylase
MDLEKFPLKGYILPLTPQGRSSLVEPPPWYYAGEVMQLVFQADPEKVKRVIPPPLEIGPEPGKGLVWFVEWISVSESNPDLAFVNPERSIYKECLVMVQCSYQGVPGYFIPYIWVDNDFTLMRGFIQGFPKKLAHIHQTRLSDLNPKIGGRRPGTKMKGICEAHGERLVEGSLIFKRQAAPSELPPVKFYLMRYFPDVENPAKPAVHELTVSNVQDSKVANIWAGDADIKFFNSDFEEVNDLSPLEVTGGFYSEMGFTITGGKVIHKYR